MPPRSPITLRSFRAADKATVYAWPAYTGEFAPLDYALRPGGWLDAFPESASTRQFGIWQNDQLVGFSLLTDIADGDAEFYIALHPAHTGRGVGRYGTVETVRLGFNELGLHRIHLKVRTSHARGIALYSKVGFSTTGEKEQEIQGSPVLFKVMEVTPETLRF